MEAVNPAPSGGSHGELSLRPTLVRKRGSEYRHEPLIIMEMAGAAGLEPAASCVTGRQLSRAVNNLLIWAHEFSSESPQKLHSVFAGESAIAEPLCREARRASVARYMLSS